MNFKILCADLDGTLLATKNNVSDFCVSEISRIKDRIKIILVSARMPQSMTYLQRRLGIEDQPLICYNGAYVIHGDNEIASTLIHISDLAGLHSLAKTYDIRLGLYHKSEWCVEENTERVRTEIHDTQATPFFRDTADTLLDWEEREIGAHKIMLMGTKNASDQILPQLRDTFGDRLRFYRSSDTLIEIAPRTVSKLSAIRLLLQGRESLQDVIAFGDNYNDLEMLQHAGSGVAVANARPEVKAVANHITLKNTEDGVAHFIKQHLLI